MHTGNISTTLQDRKDTISYDAFCAWTFTNVVTLTLTFRPKLHRLLHMTWNLPNFKFLWVASHTSRDGLTAVQSATVQGVIWSLVGRKKIYFSHVAKKKERIVLREIHLRTTGRHLSNWITQCYLLPDRSASLHPNRAGWYSIYRPHKDERLSWPSWLVTYRNGLPVHRPSPIRVLTGSDVAQLRWSKPARYH